MFECLKTILKHRTKIITVQRQFALRRFQASLFTLFAICASLVLVSGQNFLFGAHLPNRQINYNTVDFAQHTQVRDPRQNRGPVVFPPSPPDAIDESSGVIVGASGYGFVPPQQTRRG